MTNDYLVPNVDADPDTFDYDILPHDLADRMQRYASDVWRYLRDAQQSIESLAVTLKAAHDDYAANGNNRFSEETWRGWIRQFYPTLSFATADKLVLIADRIASSGGGTYPPVLTSISAIAAYLTAPEVVQEKVREGEIKPRRDEIAEATMIAQKAQKRAQELELALSKANTDLRDLEGVRQTAQHTLELALKDAENSNLKLSLLQDEMEKRVSAATASERVVIEKRYHGEIEKARAEIEKTRGELEKTRQQADRELKSANAAFREARQTAMDLAEQLKRAGDEGAIWARWEIAAVRFGKQVDAIAAELPSESEMAVWLDGHWELHADLRKRVAALLDQLDRQAQRHAAHGYVVEAD